VADREHHPGSALTSVNAQPTSPRHPSFAYGRSDGRALAYARRSLLRGHSGPPAASHRHGRLAARGSATRAAPSGFPAKSATRPTATPRGRGRPACAPRWLQPHAARSRASHRPPARRRTATGHRSAAQPCLSRPGRRDRARDGPQDPAPQPRLDRNARAARRCFSGPSRSVSTRSSSSLYWVRRSLARRKVWYT